MLTVLSLELHAANVHFALSFKLRGWMNKE